VEAHGGANIFQRVGEFPNAADPEYPVAPAASDFYKSGPSLTQRYLPLWLSVHAQRAIAVLVAGLAIGLPTFRFLPVFYQWVMRRRLTYWYAKLKALEGLIRRQCECHISTGDENRNRTDRRRRQSHPVSANLHGPAIQFTQSYRHRSAQNRLSREYARVNGGRIIPPRRRHEWSPFGHHPQSEGPPIMLLV